MIRHIVFFTIRDVGQRESIRARLARLGEIPHCLHFEVGVNAKVDPLGNEVDLVVYAEFASEAELRAYKAHPLYAQTTDAVRPLREMRLSADIQSAI